jgi:hypothetical protein
LHLKIHDYGIQVRCATAPPNKPEAPDCYARMIDVPLVSSYGLFENGAAGSQG